MPLLQPLEISFVTTGIEFSPPLREDAALRGARSVVARQGYALG